MHSIDAASAAIIAVFAYAGFSILLASAAASSASQATDAELSSFSIRLSSLVVSEAGVLHSNGTGQYLSSNELSLARLSSLDLGSLLAQSGRKYAKVSVISESGELFSKEAGQIGGEVFCSQRLALLSGQIVKVEACIS